MTCLNLAVATYLPEMNSSMGSLGLRDIFKRGFDLVCGWSGLLFLSPLLVGIAACVRMQMGAPVFFKQHRPGQYGQPFLLYKYRTMRDAKDRTGRLLPDADRITPFGRFLRATSLDELPELFNIIKGEMSVVGPRPLLMQYLDRYSTEQARRHDVKPGLTGWAQVNGRNTISWEEKFQLDVWYVDNRSLRLDQEIILKSIMKVFLREGISQTGEATMREFMGSDELGET